MDSGERVLALRRVVPAPPPVVFAALQEPSTLAQWWGPAGFTIPSIDFSTRPGEPYRIEMQPPGGAPFAVHGVFRHVDAPHGLSFTFVWDPPDVDDVETVAELTLEERDGATEVSLRQGEFKTDARLELHRGGWTESFDKLEALLAA